MKRFKLTKEEKALEAALERGEYRPVSAKDEQLIAAAIARRKKDAVLNIRVNSEDLSQIKVKAHRLGVPYQTFISEVLHRVAA
jgi:predicted DNA binding CopG/RHH family protein